MNFYKVNIACNLFSTNTKNIMEIDSLMPQAAWAHSQALDFISIWHIQCQTLLASTQLPSQND